MQDTISAPGYYTQGVGTTVIGYKTFD